MLQPSPIADIPYCDVFDSIIVVGEADHRQWVGFETVTRLLQHAGQCGVPPPDCVFVELPEDEDLSACRLGDCLVDGRNDRKIGVVSERARAVGARVYGLDLPGDGAGALWDARRAATSADERAALWRAIVVGRNEHFAAVVARHPECRRPLLFVGARHTHGPERPTVVELVRDTGYFVTAIRANCELASRDPRWRRWDLGAPHGLPLLITSDDHGVDGVRRIDVLSVCVHGREETPRASETPTR